MSASRVDFVLPDRTVARPLPCRCRRLAQLPALDVSRTTVSSTHALRSTRFLVSRVASGQDQVPRSTTVQVLLIHSAWCVLFLLRRLHSTVKLLDIERFRQMSHKSSRFTARHIRR